MSDTLDLDALLGQTKTLKVKFGGEEHELKHADALTPAEFAKLTRLGKAFQAAQTDEELERALEAVDEFLKIVGGDWALNLPMRAKLAIVRFWGEEGGAAPKN